VIKLAYYREEDWKRFIDVIDDRETMFDTWDEWYKSFLNAKHGLMKEGFEVIRIVVDIDELIDYCRSQGVRNDGKARSQFVANK
jgi:hypothetical protein